MNLIYLINFAKVLIISDAYIKMYLEQYLQKCKNYKILDIHNPYDYPLNNTQIDEISENLDFLSCSVEHYIEVNKSNISSGLFISHKK